MAGRIALDAATAVGEAALNSVFQGVAQALTPIIQKKLGSLWGVEKELKKLKRTLFRIQALLNDAEGRQFKEEGVRLWVSELRGVAYDVEDVVDGMNIELFRLQFKHGNESGRNQVNNLSPSFWLDKVVDDFENLNMKYEVASKMEDILARLDEIIKGGNALRLRKGVGGRLHEIEERQETSSLVDEENVYGREKDKENIVSLLLSRGSIRDNYSVIPIVGMGGLGKTTVAQLAYNDKRVKSYFELKIWVFVSHEFDSKRITKSIIESVTNAKYDLLDLDPMQRHLQAILLGKKFLIVLDDVWTESYSDWECLKAPFRTGKKESKIIVTTRSEKVSNIMGTMPAYRLNGLSDAHCWTLFKQRIIGEQSHTMADHQGDIVDKCKGLPLAAKTLSGLLCSVEEDQWDSILESELWDLPHGKDSILPVLKLSYLHLPPHLKRCFAYCSLFPKGYFFRRDELVRFWIAEGFVQPGGRKGLEETGNEYFDCLLSRSFFQKNWLDYVMHDHIHDLAQFISGNLCFGLLEERQKQCPTEMTRHLSLTYTDQAVSGTLYEAKGLRTFWGEGIKSEEMLHNLLQNMKFLRVLDLRFAQLTRIPDSIGNLKHLRYLNLSETTIEVLPNSVCRLYHLQTLLLSYCRCLMELPKDMKMFCKMRHLSLSGTMILELPNSICCLEELQVLDLGYTAITELPTDISNLYSLRYLNLQGTDLKKLPESVCMLYNLEKLNLKRCYGFHELPKNIQNLTKLQKLMVDTELLCRSFPSEIGRLTSLKKLRHFPVRKESGRGIGELKDLRYLHGELNISNLENVLFVEDAKLANLKNKQHIEQLRLQWNWGNPTRMQDGNVGTDILEALQPPCSNLKHLSIENYSGVKFPRWLGHTSFSNLSHVQLLNCKRCEFLPPLGQLPSLRSLVLKQIDAVKSLGSEFYGKVIGTAFPSLKKLELEDMLYLEEWCTAEGGSFPHLSDLSISFCPKLKELPIALETLRKLRVFVCDELTALPLLPSLEVLQLRNCKEGILLNSLPYLTSLSTLKISEIQGMKSMPSGLLQHLTILNTLEIENCYELSSFPARLPTSLTNLSISHCPHLRPLKGTFSHLINLYIEQPTLPVLLRTRCPSISPKFKFDH